MVNNKPAKGVPLASVARNVMLTGTPGVPTMLPGVAVRFAVVASNTNGSRASVVESNACAVTLQYPARCSISSVDDEAVPWESVTASRLDAPSGHWAHPGSAAKCTVVPVIGAPLPLRNNTLSGKYCPSGAAVCTPESDVINGTTPEPAATRAISVPLPAT